MAKYYNNKIKSGRVAGSVFAVRNGEVIERAYNPVVLNPSTAAQVEQRAKLKMISQLSAVLAPVIAIPREGNVSSRNLFTKLNIGAATYSNDTATIDINSIKVTKSDVYMAQPAGEVGSTGVTVTIANGATLDVDRVVYIALAKGDDDKVRLVGSQVVAKTESATFDATFTGLPSGTPAIGAITILAYGIRANSDAARAKYSDTIWGSANYIAQLVVSRTLLERDFTLTETRSAELTIS